MEFWIWLSNALGAGSPRVNDIVACFETAEHFYAEKKTGFRHVAFLTAAEKQKLFRRHYFICLFQPIRTFRRTASR